MDYLVKEKVQISSNFKPFKIRRIETDEFNLWCDRNLGRNNGCIKTTIKNLRLVKEHLQERNVNMEIPRIIISDFTKVDRGLRPSAIAAYHNDSDTIFINSNFKSDEDILEYLSSGYFSSQSVLHPYLHELGHKRYYNLVERLSTLGYNSFEKQMKEQISDKSFLLFQLSSHSKESWERKRYGEVYAEAFASDKSNKIIQIINDIERGVFL